MSYILFIIIPTVLLTSVVSENSTNEYLNFNTEDTSENHVINIEISQCIRFIVDQYFLRKDSIPMILAINNKSTSLDRESLFLKDFYSELVKEIENVPASVVIIHSILIRSTLSNSNFIIIIDDAESLTSNISLLPVVKYEYKGRIIFIYLPKKYKDEEILKNIQKLFEICHGYNMVNVIVVAYIQGYPRIYSFHLYTPKVCLNTLAVELDVWRNGELTNKTINFFPKKTRNLHKCPLKVAAVMRKPHVFVEYVGNITKFDGVEVHLVNVLSRLMNFTYTIYEPDNKTRWGYWNGTNWVGSLGDIIYKKADIAIGAYIPGLEEYYYIDFSYGYDTADVIWTLPRFERDDPWVKMFLPFRLRLWILVVATIIMIIVLFLILRYTIDNRSVKVKNIFMDVWQISLGVAVEHMPMGTFVCYIYLLWIWMSMVLRNIYQGSLVGYLTGTIYEDRVKVMQDILDENLEIYGAQAVADYLANVDDEVVQTILSKMILIGIKEYDIIARQIAVNNMHATLLHIRPQVLQLNKMFEKEGVLNIMKEIYRTQIISLVLGKYSPLYDNINDWIMVISEVGLLDKWTEDYQAILIPQSTEHIILKMKHILGPFLVLFVGMLLAMLAFIEELVYYKYFETKPEKPFVLKKIY